MTDRQNLIVMGANLKHGYHTGDDARIGGGVFSPEEQLAAGKALIRYPRLLEEGRALVNRLSTMALHPSHYAEFRDLLEAAERDV